MLTRMICLVAAVTLAGPAARGQGLPPDPLSELRRLWARQQDEVSSARIRFRIYSNAEQVKPVSRAEVRAAVAAAGMADQPDGLRLLLDRLTTARPAVPGASLWAVKALVVDGSRHRVEHISGGNTTLVRDGRSDIRRTDFNGRVVIGRVGSQGEKVPSLDDFRLLPHPKLPLTVSPGPNGRLVADEPAAQGGGRLVIDPTDGAVSERTVVSRADQSGLCELFDGFIQHSGGVVFPRVAVRVVFGPGGKASSLSTTVIEDAQFNVPTSAADWTVAARPGTIVVDQRAPQTVSFKSKAGGANVVTLADAWLAQPRPEGETASSGPGPAAGGASRPAAGVIAAAVVVVGGLGIAWHRWRRTGPVG